MSLLSLISMLTCFGTLALGGASLFAERGYGFDLRRRQQRRAAERDGGRRQEDLASA